MTLICKGRRVAFEMATKNGIDVIPDPKYALLHDPTGRAWKADSLLVMPFVESGDETPGDKFTRDYLGRNHLVRAGDVKLPPKKLSSWRLVGEIQEIFYDRHGAKYGGHTFRHRFNKSLLGRLVKGTGAARLYERCFGQNRIYRIDLPSGAILDGRGFVWP